MLSSIRCIFYFLLLFLLGQNSIQAQENLLFKRISDTDGLSNNSIQCIFQDSNGFIWFGSLNGLNRFDGKDFLVFNHNSHDKKSISNDVITSIQEDQYKMLWIGTAKGINIYDPTTGEFLN